MIIDIKSKCISYYETIGYIECDFSEFKTYYIKNFFYETTHNLLENLYVIYNDFGYVVLKTDEYSKYFIPYNTIGYRNLMINDILN